MGGAFSAAWFSAIVPATLSGGAPLLFMVPFWLAGGLVVKQTVIDPALATEVSIGRYAWSCKAVGPGGVVIKEREGATDDLRGATAEIAAYVNGVPQCALRLLVDGAEPVSLGASLAPDELDAIADQINAFLDDVEARGLGGVLRARVHERVRDAVEVAVRELLRRAHVVQLALLPVPGRFRTEKLKSASWIQTDWGHDFMQIGSPWALLLN